MIWRMSIGFPPNYAVARKKVKMSLDKEFKMLTIKQNMAVRQRTRKVPM